MYNNFRDWLNDILQNNRFENVKAFNFNLYEDADENDSPFFSVQLIGAPFYNPENDDWACNELYSSEENLFIIDNCEDWEDCLDIATKLIREYLYDEKCSVVLKLAEVVAVGFVDGDLEVVSYNDQSEQSR